MMAVDDLAPNKLQPISNHHTDFDCDNIVICAYWAGAKNIKHIWTHMMTGTEIWVDNPLLSLSLVGSYSHSDDALWLESLHFLCEIIFVGEFKNPWSRWSRLRRRIMISGSTHHWVNPHNAGPPGGRSMEKPDGNSWVISTLDESGIQFRTL